MDCSRQFLIVLVLADEGFNISTFYFIDFFNGKNGLVNRHFFLHQAKETFRLPKMVRQIPSAGLLGALSHFTLGARLRLELDQHVFSSSGFKRKCGSALAVSLTACKNSQQDRNHEKQMSKRIDNIPQLSTMFFDPRILRLLDSQTLAFCARSPGAADVSLDRDLPKPIPTKKKRLAEAMEVSLPGKIPKSERLPPDGTPC